jgi:hypothetical protein
VFISYLSNDRGRVLPIARELEKVGVHVWMDLISIPAGANYGLAIAEGIQHCSALLLACSPEALQSRNVKQEIQLAWKHQRPYLPLLLEPTTFPNEIEYWLEGYQWVEILDNPKEEWLPRVVQALKKLGVPSNSDVITPTSPATEPGLPISGALIEPRITLPPETAAPAPRVSGAIAEKPTDAPIGSKRFGWTAMAAIVGVILAVAALVLVVAPWRGGQNPGAGAQPSGPSSGAPSRVEDGRGAGSNVVIPPVPATIGAPTPVRAVPPAPASTGDTPSRPTSSVPVIPMGS